MEPTIYPDRATWLDARRDGVGASEVAAICGLSPYASALSVWIDKTRGREETDSDELAYGREMEGAIIARFARESGKCVKSHPYAVWRSVRWPWMTCTPDAWCCDENAGVEAKTQFPYHRTGAIPLAWELQAQAQMAVMGWERVYIPTYYGGRQFEILTVERDEETIEEIARITKTFWELVTSDTMPEPGHLDAQALAEYFPPVDAVMVLSPEGVELVRRIRAQQELVRMQQESLEVSKNLLRALMASATVAEFEGEVLATWRPDSRGRRVLRIVGGE